MTDTATPDIAMTFDERTIPAAAMRMPVSCQFAAAKDRTSDTFPLYLFARSTEPVKHWYWGDIYHDFSGMKVSPTIPIDYCHSDDEIIGVGSSFKTDGDGLHIEGKLVQVKDGDRVAQIMKLSDAGVPFEASIDFRGDCLYEEVMENRIAQVNGRQVQGPALIVREWTLRGCAVCPHGMDSNTSSQFSQDEDKPVIVRIFSVGDSMTKSTMTGNPPANTTTTTAPAQQQTSAATGTPAAAAVPATQQSASAGGTADPDPAQQFRQELKRYVDKFGAERGTQWYTEGKTWAEACELHADHCHKQLAASEEKNQQLTEKLNSLHTGELVPATQSQDSSEKTPDGNGGQMDNRFSHMGQVGVFASSIKIPGK